MKDWWNGLLAESAYFMPHGHCYLWIPSLLWLHVVSDVLIGTAYVGITIVLWGLVRRLRLPFGPVILAFGFFIALCGGTHFMEVWTVWNPDYWLAGTLKAATALASVATAISLLVVKPQIQRVTEAARLSEERRIQLESAHAELEALYDQLKEANAFKSRFFANVSHELRTPLALMVGPARQLQVDDNLTEPQRRALKVICDNGAILLRQVEDLLDMARLEAHRMTLEYGELDVVPWSEDLVTQFGSLVEQRGLVLSIDAPPALVVQVDGRLLGRAVINLLSNAIKFTPHGGTIAITLSTNGDRAVMSVADSGPGVPIAQRAAIFERFDRGDADISQRVGGTGLGLSIAREFVELHGGRLTVRDAALGGALFTIEVPLRAPADAAWVVSHSNANRIALQGALSELSSPATTEISSAPLHGSDAARVLLIEDNVEMAAFVRDVLSRDFAVTIATDGLDGFAKAEVLRPDLVISDLTMPGMSGEALLKAVRAKPEMDHIAMLMLTARADDELRVRLLRAGAQDFLVKPFLPDELKARAHNLVSTKRAGDTLRETLSGLSGDLESLAREVTIKNRHLANALAAAEVARTQAEQASLVKSSFLGLLSHEIRTPLAAILMNLELLSRDKTAALAPPVKVKVDRLTVAAKQLNTLMEGLLEYTRFENEGIEPNLQPIDPIVLAREVIDEHVLLMQGSKVALRFEEGGAPIPTLRSDLRLLKVLLSNLINNAIKFTREGSITLRITASGDDCILSVTDTGEGIPAAALARIFLPFEQLEPLHRKSLPGVGLGLALVRQIAQSLRGRIDVESEPGVGSTFRVILPCEPLPVTRGDES